MKKVKWMNKDNKPRQSAEMSDGNAEAYAKLIESDYGATKVELITPEGEQ